MGAKYRTVAVRSLWVVLFFGFILSIQRLGDTEALGRGDATKVAREGNKLSEEEVKDLEDRLEANPDDLASRTKLLGYYFRTQFKSSYARKVRQKHIMWIIENRPEAEIAGLPYASLNPILDGLAYHKAKKLWLKQVETQEKNTAILGNAANFFIIHDRDISESLLNKAQVLEPDNPEWSERLGELYLLDMHTAKSIRAKKNAAKKALKQFQHSLTLTVDETHRFYRLADVAEAAFEAGETEKARTYATELLDKAATHRNDWNYGNAIHHGNLILGRIALKSGDLEKAKECLIKAGNTPGSPQLNSFGPNMTLAKELLEKGEREVVIKYFQLCANFWKGGRDRLKNWTSTVKGGGIPDFGANLDY